MNSDTNESPRFQGIIPPLVTPLAGPDSIDELGLRRLIEHLIGSGVHGLFILGTTGEAPSLSQRVRRDLITLTCKLVDGRLPVLVGITECVPSQALELGAVAADQGAAAVVAAPPYYYSVTQGELARYFEDLADRLELPLMLYNMPSMTKIRIEIETLERLAGCRSIIGLKDSGGDLGYFAEALKIKQQRPDWSIMVGPERLLSETIRLGGNGGVNGGSHLFPRLFVACYEAHRRGDRDQADHLQAQIQALQSLYATGGDDPQRFLKVIKHSLARMGICGDRLAEPLRGLIPAQLEALEAQLAELRKSHGKLGNVSPVDSPS